MAKKLRKNQFGASLVEMAIIVFLFFIVIFGIIDFGFLLYNKQVITNAAREAARFGIVARDNYSPVNSDDVINVVNDYIEKNIITFGDDNPTSTVKFFPSPIDLSNPVSSKDSSETVFRCCEKFQDAISVEVDYNHSYIFFPFEQILNSEAFMFCEGGPEPTT